jgi:ATP-binding cassette subfamily B protein
MYSNNSNNPIHYSWSCLLKHKYSIILLFFDVIFSSLFAFIPAYIIKNIINSFSVASSYNDLIIQVKEYIAFYFIFFFISIIIFRMYDYFINIKTFPEIKKEIIVEKFCFVIQQTKHFFQENFSGEIAEKIDDLQDNVIELIKWFFNKILIHVLSVIITCAGLLYFNYYCGIIIISWIIFFIIIAIFFTKKIAMISQKWANQTSMLNGIFVDIFSNFLIVKLFNNITHEKENIKKQAEKIQESEESIEWYFFLGWTCYSISFFIVQALSFYVLFQQYKKGMANQSDFAFVWTINSSIVNILWRFLKDFVDFPKYYSIIKESLLILNKEIKIKNLSNKKLVVTNGQIDFKNVSFSFEKNIIFENLSLHIPAKTKVGFVGFSGSGKTTFMNILLRLYEIDSGEILIDNQNIKEVQLESLYQAISVIPQEASLFHRTILENVLYGKQDANKKELDKSISLAALDQLISMFPDNYHTRVGERGSRMSGGQKQRIAIARAYLKNTQILILDEATSNLDSVTENLIQNNLQTMMQDKTVLIIAHRLSTIEKMDRILVFNEGKIVQDGTHLELMAQEGLYKKLWEMQSCLL